MTAAAGKHSTGSGLFTEPPQTRHLPPHVSTPARPLLLLLLLLALCLLLTLSPPLVLPRAAARRLSQAARAEPQGATLCTCPATLTEDDKSKLAEDVIAALYSAGFTAAADYYWASGALLKITGKATVLAPSDGAFSSMNAVAAELMCSREIGKDTTEGVMLNQILRTAKSAKELRAAGRLKLSTYWDRSEMAGEEAETLYVRSRPVTAKGAKTVMFKALDEQYEEWFEGDGIPVPANITAPEIVDNCLGHVHGTDSVLLHYNMLAFPAPCAMRLTPKVKKQNANDLIRGLKEEGYTKASHSFQATGALLSVTGPVTVLSPSDEAFAKLPKVVAAKLADKVQGPELLRKIMRSHIVRSSNSARELKSSPKAFTTLQGSKVQASQVTLASGFRSVGFTAVKGYDTARASIERPGMIVSCIGHVQGIDMVVLPQL